MPRKPRAGPKKDKGGRPPIELTTETALKITNALASGVPRTHAAALADVSVRTMMRWREKGAAALSGKYFKFCRDMKRAEAFFVAEQLAVIKKIGQGKYESDRAPVWTALAWLLERRFPYQFGSHSHTTIKAPKGGAKSAQLVLIEGPSKIEPPEDMP